MYTLLRKEISTFLSSLIGYAVIIVYLLINGLFLWVFPLQFNILDFGFASIDNYFMLAPWVFLFLIPAITMRSFAEEQKNGTMEMLLTKPITDLEIILAKYLAGVVLVLFSVLPTLIYYITVYQLGMPAGNLDHGGTWGSYIGLVFLGAGFVAIGIFASAISNNQIVSFLIAVFLCGFMYTGFEFIYDLSVFGSFGLFVSQLGINAHYTGMSRGVIDTRDLLYFLSLITFFLMLTRFRLERRKW
jgi:ABC-2 type transport system permease protein